MRLILNRIKQDENQTTGILSIIDDYDDHPIFVCPAIERGWRDNQRNVSCIPPGTYPIFLEWSPRFDRKLWEIKDVPGRSECKIHSANWARELNGCIAPGLIFKDLDGDGYNDVSRSKLALNIIHSILKDLTRTTITID